MSDSLILEHLRAIRAEAAEDRAEQREQRVRLGAIEQSLAHIARSLAHVEADVSELRAEMNGRLDRVARPSGPHRAPARPGGQRVMTGDNPAVHAARLLGIPRKVKR